MRAQMRRDELKAAYAKLPVHTAGRTLAIRRRRAAMESELAALERSIGQMRLKLRTDFLL